jgi:hypothetical protein
MDADYDGPVSAWNKSFPSGPFHQGDVALKENLL